MGIFCLLTRHICAEFKNNKSSQSYLLVVEEYTNEPTVNGCAWICIFTSPQIGTHSSVYRRPMRLTRLKRAITNACPIRKPRSYPLPVLCTSYIFTLVAKNESTRVTGAMMPCQIPVPVPATRPNASG